MGTEYSRIFLLTNRHGVVSFERRRPFCTRVLRSFSPFVGARKSSSAESIGGRGTRSRGRKRAHAETRRSFSCEGHNARSSHLFRLFWLSPWKGGLSGESARPPPARTHTHTRARSRQCILCVCIYVYIVSCVYLRRGAECVDRILILERARSLRLFTSFAVFFARF